MLTGTGIKALRNQVGLSASKLADTLGVSTPTVFRWESYGNSIPAMEDRHMQYLLSLQRAVQRSDEPEAIGRSIAGALVVGGALLGLFMLLKAAFEDDD
ncbi:MAG: helix-turn-helix domain-containing protein [Planctomycetes bacterium]|nr:helix-turn-helix domain-containing protein [Planctomycetota bacterium]